MSFWLSMFIFLLFFLKILGYCCLSWCVLSRVNVTAGLVLLVQTHIVTCQVSCVVSTSTCWSLGFKMSPFPFFGLETWNNCACDGKLSFCYIKLQTPAVDLDYLYRWILADSCYFIIPQVERCLDKMTFFFFPNLKGDMKNCSWTFQTSSFHLSSLSGRVYTLIKH